MANKRRISDGATLDDLQVLLLTCTRKLKALTPPGEDLNLLYQIEAEMAWQASLDTWLAANPEKRGAVVSGSDRSH